MRHSSLFSRLFPQLLTLALWALLAALVTFWALRLWATNRHPPPPPLPQLAAALQLDAQALSRVLGAGHAAVVASPANPPPASQARYVLLGVLAGRDSGAGAAVIAVGQQAARPFRVGSAVGDEGLVLQSLSAHEARLGRGMDGPASVTLRLSLPPPPVVTAARPAAASPPLR